MQRFLLKMSVITLLISNAMSFGMIVRYKNKENKRILDKSAVAYCTRNWAKKINKLETLPDDCQSAVVNSLDNPIVFGKTSKANHAFVKGIGEHNLVTLYRNQDPAFVSPFLLSHYVPVLLVNRSSHDNLYFYSVDPYVASFYSASFRGKKCLDPLCVSLKSKRLNQALEQKKIQYGVSSVWHLWEINSPLVKATLFGCDEDISKELKKTKDTMRDDIEAYGMRDAIKAVISYPHKENNALELLLLGLKQRNKESNINDICKGLYSYELLMLAAKNRKAFELISNIDPYKANKLIWTKCINDYNPQTTLDRMVNDKHFDRENIKVFTYNGGMTSWQVHQMNIVGDIVKNLSRRDNVQRMDVNEGFSREQFGTILMDYIRTLLMTVAQEVLDGAFDVD